MFTKLLQLIGVSCRHRNMSHPFASAGFSKKRTEDWDAVTESGGHYVVCLDCGKKFQYDWANMRVVG